LPGSERNGEAQAVSESFGTLRYGRLLEALLYTTRRAMTLAGPSAVFLEDTVEKWLTDRMAQSDANHVVNVPSAPMGWTAGKWAEWYPDRLGTDGKMTSDPPKSYWQSGWMKQHDRLMAAMSGMINRIALVISGDLHASAFGRIEVTGDADLSANPVFSVLCGTIGTGPQGWPSHSRGVLPQPSLKLMMDEIVAPIENHGFAIADFTKHAVKIKMFKWDRSKQSSDDIDTLMPFHEIELRRSVDE
jgi:phosphodiesterase/alkaline phosphatase D-like protein